MCYGASIWPQEVLRQGLHEALLKTYKLSSRVCFLFFQLVMYLLQVTPHNTLRAIEIQQEECNKRRIKNINSKKV